MADRSPIRVEVIGGRVLAVMDPATTRDLAEAFSMAFATCDELEQERPRCFDDVVALHPTMSEELVLMR